MVHEIPLAPEAGFQVFLSERDRPFGAVLAVEPEFVIYVENAGEFQIAPEAIVKVHDEKVIVDPAKLDERLRQAIGHAHDAEDRS